MSDESEGFLGRWSRLKQSHRKEIWPPSKPEDTESALAPAPTEESVQEQPATDAPEGNDGEDLNLPPIESLGKDSDFSPFLQEGVPEEIQRLALRKLWTSDPVLANLDGLLEYGEDFSAPWRTNTVVKTLYRVGQGMPGLLADTDEEVAASTEAAWAEADAPVPAATEPVSSSESADAAADREEVEVVDSAEEMEQGRGMSTPK